MGDSLCHVVSPRCGFVAVAVQSFGAHARVVLVSSFGV